MSVKGAAFGPNFDTVIDKTGRRIGFPSIPFSVPGFPGTASKTPARQVKIINATGSAAKYCRGGK
jgi:hypothetical protein